MSVQSPGFRGMGSRSRVVCNSVIGKVTVALRDLQSLDLKAGNLEITQQQQAPCCFYFFQASCDRLCSFTSLLPFGVLGAISIM
uniref:Uncharacterized protein n=1 Tax=Anguilla anguilla TaxID=7936 RepID=A0A0E9S314_ANGAN